MIEDLIVSMGGTVGMTWPITYYRTKPCVVIAADFRANPVFDYPNLTGLDDDFTPGKVMEKYRPNLILDTCAGRGLTARTAESLGIGSLTHELSPYRMAEAIKSLVKVNPALIPAKQ